MLGWTVNLEINVANSPIPTSNLLEYIAVVTARSREDDDMDDYDILFEDNSTDSDDVESDDDEWDSDLSARMRTKYGAMGQLLYQRLSHAKLFPMHDYIKKLVAFTVFHLKSRSCPSTYKKMATLMQYLPPLQDLRHEVVGHTLYNSKENLVIRVILEAYSIYYTHFTGPPFSVYRIQVLPLWIEFYSNIPNNLILKSVNTKLKRLISQLKPEPKGEFFFFKTKKEYVDHYRRKLRNASNLNEGITQQFV